MTDGRRQYDLDRIEAQRAQETEDWLARMRAERAAAEAAKAPACCRSFARYRYHDYYCSKNFSRSAGS